MRGGREAGTISAGLPLCRYIGGLGARQVKLGSPVRGERNAKYSRLMRIEQDLI